MDLNKEITKISKFAKTLVPKEEEYFQHNLRRCLMLLVLIALHFILSFVVIYTNIYLGIILAILNGYFTYYYLVISVHEGAHNLIFITKNKSLAKIVRRIVPSLPILAGFPFFNGYLRDHKMHHKNLSEKDDPQNSAFLNMRRIPKYYFSLKRPKYSFRSIVIENTNFALYIFFILLKIAHIYLLFFFGGLYGFFLGLVLPLMIAAALNLMRISFRHYKLFPNPMPLRSRSYTFFGARIFGPDGLIYHFEHHLYPNLPSNRLKKVYDFVEENCSKELIEKVHYKQLRIQHFW